MADVYVVFGEVHEYNFHKVWSVRAFNSRGAAEAFKATLTPALVDFAKSYAEDDAANFYRDSLDYMRSNFDPQFSHSCVSCTRDNVKANMYRVVAVPLDEAP